MDGFHPPQDESFCCGSSFRKFSPIAKNYLGFWVPSPSLKVRGKVQNFQVAFLQKKIKILHADLFLSSIISAPNQLQIPNLSL